MTEKHCKEDMLSTWSMNLWKDSKPVNAMAQILGIVEVYVQWLC